MVASDVAGMPFGDLAGGMAETIPDALPLAILVPAALDMIGSGSRAP
jgi:hypothetical protein